MSQSFSNPCQLLICQNAYLEMTEKMFKWKTVDMSDEDFHSDPRITFDKVIVSNQVKMIKSAINTKMM